MVKKAMSYKVSHFFFKSHFTAYFDTLGHTEVGIYLSPCNHDTSSANAILKAMNDTIVQDQVWGWSAFLFTLGGSNNNGEYSSATVWTL